MVFSLREAIGGFKHLSLGWTRTLAKRPDNYFIGNHETAGLCPICGYAMIRLELPDGWSFDTCSAMPTVTALDSKQFADWAKTLSRAKLPTVRV